MSLRERRAIVAEFQKIYKEYLSLNSNEFKSRDQHSRQEELRQKINRLIPIVSSNIQFVGESVIIHYAPPPAVGGLSGQVDLLTNIFNRSIMGRTTHTLDLLDRTIGRYDYLIQNRWKQYINPFYWIGEVIRLPFHLLRFCGFNVSKWEFSIFGKIYKLLASLVALGAGLIKLYEFMVS